MSMLIYEYRYVYHHHFVKNVTLFRKERGMVCRTISAHCLQSHALSLTVVIILEMAMIAMIGKNAVMITVIMLKTLTTLYMAGLVGAPGDENVDCTGWRE